MKALILPCLLLLSSSLRADIVFTWTNCPNHLTGSATVVWQGSDAALNYKTPYYTYGPTLTFSDGWLHDGINYFACQQVATNSNGTAAPTVMSGEIQVMKIPSVRVDLSILTSTNLGVQFTPVSTQSVVFPTSDAQRFFMASQIRSTRTNQVVLPPSPSP